MSGLEKDIIRELKILDEKDTEKLGLEIASELKPGDVLALVGDLGTGKTTLTKYIAKGLGIPEGITSPTFTIVNEHRGGRIPLYHFDAYRLEGQDPFETGIEEYFYQDGVSVVEWADIIEEILPEHTMFIFLEYSPEGRVYQCTF